jgi:hypothetical protein
LENGEKPTLGARKSHDRVVDAVSLEGVPNVIGVAIALRRERIICDQSITPEYGGSEWW